MAHTLGKTQRLKRKLSRGARWLARLLWPAPAHAKLQGRWQTPTGPIVWTSNVPIEGSRPLIVSLGFGASVDDYAPLSDLFQDRQPVYKVGHPGSDRWAALKAVIYLGWRRFILREPSQQAARGVRTYLHRQEARERRLDQLSAAVSEIRARHGETAVDLAGHSFGTDTALMFAIKYGHLLEIETLYLFSPHPPGYLIDTSCYADLPVKSVVVVTGTRDTTRDGVGPARRLEVMPYLGPKARAIVLEGGGHMDVAFPGIGPPDALRTLQRELWPDDTSSHEEQGGR